MERIEVQEPQQQGQGSGVKLQPWQTVLIVLATWLVSTAVNWGVIQQRQEDMIRRQDAADRVISQQVPRTEFDTWRDEMQRRLERMEEKLDTLLIKKGS